MIVVGLLLAGAVGALLRYEVELHVRRRLGPEFPWGTLVINVSGGFVLGLLTGLAAHHGISSGTLTVLGTGLLGAYTTFSTFTYETVRLLEDGRLGEAGVNVAVSVVVGFGAAAAGLALGMLV